jgi:hypothetical protein
MHGHLTTKSLRFVVQKRFIQICRSRGADFELGRWSRVRGFPRREQAERYAEKHPGETYRIRDLREGGNG